MRDKVSKCYYFNVSKSLFKKIPIYFFQKRLEELKREYDTAEKPPLDLSLVPGFMKKEGTAATGKGVKMVQPVQPIHPLRFQNTVY